MANTFQTSDLYRACMTCGATPSEEASHYLGEVDVYEPSIGTRLVLTCSRCKGPAGPAVTTPLRAWFDAGNVPTVHERFREQDLHEQCPLCAFTGTPASPHRLHWHENNGLLGLRCRRCGWWIGARQPVSEASR
jgi:hypothetical protein